MALIDGYGSASLAIEGEGKLIKLPKLQSVSAVTPTKIRATFDTPMTDDMELRAPSNYVVEVISPVGVAAAVSVLEVTPENTTYPTFVDLDCTEMMQGASYNFRVSTSGPIDRWGSNLDPSGNEQGFTGLGEAPGISSVEAISENRIDVVFTESMRDTPDLRDAGTYLFDQGLTTLSVLEVDGERIKLVTSDQAPGVLYTLTLNV